MKGEQGVRIAATANLALPPFMRPFLVVRTPGLPVRVPVFYYIGAGAVAGAGVSCDPATSGVHLIEVIRGYMSSARRRTP